MKPLALRAHFDGERIQLDEPFELQAGAPVVVMIRPDVQADPDREAWLRLAAERLADAYGEDEPEYPLSLIKERNPDYEGG